MTTELELLSTRPSQSVRLRVSVLLLQTES